jgi:hypothetical protein
MITIIIMGHEYIWGTIWGESEGGRKKEKDTENNIMKLNKHCLKEWVRGEMEI